MRTGEDNLVTWGGERADDVSLDEYQFRRINGLPPYVFTIINDLKAAARRAGHDVVDLGFGNPDIPSSSIAVEKLAEAARNARNHRYSPLFAGAEVAQVRVTGDGDRDFLQGCIDVFQSQWPRPRVILCSFPHNPTTTCIDLDAMTALVRFAADNDVVLVHDFAYSDTAFDGYSPPSVLQVPGAKECSVELYTLTKSFSMAGWRVGFLVGNAKVVAALKKIKSYLDYGTFQPIQIAATVTLNDAPDYPKEVAAIYQGRRDALCDSFGRIGWEIERPRGTMFVWAPIPAAYADMGSLDFAQMLVTEAKVAVSPGVGFGLGGEGYVRFALIENEQRIAQAARTIRRALPKLG